MNSAPAGRHMVVHGRIVVVGPGDVVVGSWPLEGCGPADLSLVDALARFHVAARRLGWCASVRDPSPDLAELLELAGLREVLIGPHSRVHDA